MTTESDTSAKVAAAYFVGALGTTRGVEETLRGLDVITWFELRTAKAGPIPVVNWSHVEQGRIDRIRVTFDPRPLLA